MLKQLFLLFNFVTLSFVTFILNEDLKVSSNLPYELKQDSTYIVEVIIDKGDIIGFAKFQQNLPQGFNVEPVEVSDASFTYADGKIKFIWMAIPDTSQVLISYKITATSDAPTEGLAEGKFSYIDEMERKSYDLPNQNLKVLKPEDMPIEVEAVAEVLRNVQAIGGNEYEITLQISKQGIEGFSKIEEFLPEATSAEVIENKLSVFSQVGEKAKFVWMSIPQDEFLEVKYKVSSEDENALASLQSMEGNMSFLDDNETKTVAVLSTAGGEVAMTSDTGIENDATADSKDDNADNQEVSGTETDAVANSDKNSDASSETSESMADTGAQNEEKDSMNAGKEEEKSSQTEVATSSVKSTDLEMADNKAAESTEMASADPSTPTEIARVPNPETGVSYKVQIIAGHKMVDKQHINKKYNYSAEYQVENHEGWIKYVTGGFDQYKKARDQRESIVAAGHNFPGPFVTAYNSGERITVQEALMITNQQWVK